MTEPTDTTLARPIVVDPRAGAAAADAAAATTFARYRQEQRPQTLRRQSADLALFARYLAAVQAIPADHATAFAERLFEDATAWTNITWALIEGFIQWQLQQGYATGSIGVRLATVQRYAGLAHQAGVLDTQAIALIRTVRAIGPKRARALDSHREQTRVSSKKAQAILLTGDQITALLTLPTGTPQGRRDRLLLRLFLDHGLRVGEVAALTLAALRLADGTLRFYREKVHLEQTHKLTADTLVSAFPYVQQDLAGVGATGSLWRRSYKDGSLGTAGWSAWSIRDYIRTLGRRHLGIANLSPHDLRHTWATRAERGGTPPLALKVAGGWSSLAMVERYVHTGAIANAEVRLG